MHSFVDPASLKNTSTQPKRNSFSAMDDMDSHLFSRKVNEPIAKPSSEKALSNQNFTSSVNKEESQVRQDEEMSLKKSNSLVAEASNRRRGSQKSGSSVKGYLI